LFQTPRGIVLGSYHLRRADPLRDNAALCELARRCPQGRRLRFYHQRTDFWERCRLHSDATVYVVEKQGQPVATATIARKAMWLGDRLQPAAYVFDVMVDPEQRGRGLARTLLRALRDHCPEVCLFYSYILDDNIPSRRLFETEGFTDHPRRLLYYPVLPLLVARQPPAGFARLEAQAEAIDVLLRKSYEFRDSTVGHDGVFLLHRGKTRAWAALRRHDPQVFVGMPWYWLLLSRLLPFLPGRGRPLRVWSLHHLGATGSGQRAALQRLISAASHLATREGADALVLPLFESDLRHADVFPLTLTRWGAAPGVTHLYVAGEQAEVLLAAPRPLLMSGKDG
jgi:GNAT superfamily N-acetyltransferase